MGQFENDNIVCLYGVVTDIRDTIIVMDYMTKGDFQKRFDQLEKCNFFSNECLKFYQLFKYRTP